MGRLRCTGPGRPLTEVLSPRATRPASGSDPSAVWDHLAAGAAMAAWSSSWKAPMPACETGLWPLIITRGDSAARATKRPVTPLQWPGPAVSRATPGSPVRRPQPSAMCTAAASWRVWMSRRPLPMQASKIGRFWLPERAKRWRTPAAVSAWTTLSAPVMGAARAMGR